MKKGDIPPIRRGDTTPTVRGDTTPIRRGDIAPIARGGITPFWELDGYGRGPDSSPLRHARQVKGGVSHNCLIYRLMVTLSPLERG